MGMQSLVAWVPVKLGFRAVVTCISLFSFTGRTLRVRQCSLLVTCVHKCAFAPEFCASVAVVRVAMAALDEDDSDKENELSAKPCTRRRSAKSLNESIERLAKSVREIRENLKLKEFQPYTLVGVDRCEAPSDKLSGDGKKFIGKAYWKSHVPDDMAVPDTKYCIVFDVDTESTHRADFDKIRAEKAKYRQVSPSFVTIRSSEKLCSARGVLKCKGTSGSNEEI